jgi:hypothetical protein
VLVLDEFPQPREDLREHPEQLRPSSAQSGDPAEFGREPVHSDTRCNDCGMETLSAEPGVPTEHYSVDDDVWRQAGAGKRDHLCIGCLEKRLGRQLNRHDFMPGVDVNDPDFPETERYAWSWRSDRLKDRLRRDATGQRSDLPELGL